MRGYSLVSLAIGVFYVAALVALVGGVSIGVWLWFEADEIARGGANGASIVGPVGRFTAAELTSAAVILGTGGVTFSLIFGFVAQLLSMLRNQAMNSDRQVRLLAEMLSLHEQEMSAVAARRVAPCEGCGKLAGVERIDSGQWVCVECRRALRSA
jgi:hypothetical protein